MKHHMQTEAGTNLLERIGKKKSTVLSFRASPKDIYELCMGEPIEIEIQGINLKVQLSENQHISTKG